MAFWYVRPDITHNTVRDGTSYATAWGGWTAVVWASLAAGDTLYVCGAHTYGAVTTVGAHNGSSAAKVKISGAYAPDPGSLTYVGGAFYLECSKSFTSIEDLTIQAGTSFAHIIRTSTTLTDVDVLRNTFIGVQRTSGGGPLISVRFDATTGVINNINISNNKFRDNGITSASQAGWGISWFGGGGGETSHTSDGIKIEYNDFTNIWSGRAVISLRTGATQANASKANNVSIKGNRFFNCKGFGIETGFDVLTQIGTWSNYSIIYNEFYNQDKVINTVSTGAAIVPRTLTKSLIAYNKAYNVRGDGGFINIFASTFTTVSDNYVNTVNTDNIDGCGILVDHDNDNIIVARNTIDNCIGRTETTNAAGSAILILGATNIKVYSNSGTGNRGGIVLGSLTGSVSNTQSGEVKQNTFQNNGAFAIACTSALARPDLFTFASNVFTGTGANTYQVFDNTAINWTANEFSNWFYKCDAGTFQHTLGANDSTNVNPQINMMGQPILGSPIIGISPSISAQRDNTGMNFLKPLPSIGAFEYVKPRTSRT